MNTNNRPTVQELMEHEFDSLPESVQKVLEGPDMEKTVSLAQESAVLTERETDILSIDIIYVLFGVISLNAFDVHIKKDVGLVDGMVRLVSDICRKGIFNKAFGISEQDKAAGRKVSVQEKRPEEDSLSHVDILSEIENPTPSIQTDYRTQPVTQEPEVSSESIEEAKEDVMLNSEATTPMQNPTLGGFSPIDSSIHPASPMADKLNGKLTESTSSVPKEIYHVKKPDPYHEPIE